MDALNSLHSTTFEIDEKHGTDYHKKFLDFVKIMHEGNFVIGGAMTDPKGDRGKGPSEQADPDLFVHIVEKTDKGVYVTGAKAHQTGCINSHWIILMPTINLSEADKDYAIVGAIQLTLKVSRTFTEDSHVIRAAWKMATLIRATQCTADKRQ